MNEELTNDWIDGALSTARQVTIMRSSTVERLATALLEERAKSKDDVWKYASDGTTTADVYYGDHMLVSATPDHTFTRELPKTRARQIAEELTGKIANRDATYEKSVFYFDGEPLVDVIEAVLNKYAEELEEKE